MIEYLETYYVRRESQRIPMQNDKSFMSPVSSLIMLIATSPYIGMRYGSLPLVFLVPLILYFIQDAFKFYRKKSSERNTTFFEALEEDLPDMSPVHFVFFMLIAAPIFLFITGGRFQGLAGIAVLWVIYAIYYYGFRRK